MAVMGLHPTVRLWMSRALRAGWHPVGPGSYDGGPGGTVCPIVAAAKLAGAWSEEGLRAGWDEWGTPEWPSPPVEEFAACFDLCADEIGVEPTIGLLSEALSTAATAARRVA